MEPQIRAGVLVNFAPTVEKLGRNPMAVVSRAGLAPDILFNPESFIPYRDYLHLLDTASRETGNPYFGLVMSRELGAENMGVTGFVMTQAENIGSAWQSLSRFYHVHDTYGTVELDRLGSSARITYSIPRNDLPGTRQALDIAAGLTFNINRMLCGVGFSADSITFPYPQPADLSQYDHLEHQQLLFGQSQFSVVFHESWLVREISHSDPQMKSILEDYLLSQEISNQHASRVQVEELIKGFLPTGECNLKHVARFMSVSARTLQNRLEAEHTSFQLLLDKVRRKLATQYLDRGDMQITHLAYLLGYSELSAFSRSFKRWYDCSPKQWQKQAAIDQAAPS